MATLYQTRQVNFHKQHGTKLDLSDNFKPGTLSSLQKEYANAVEKLEELKVKNGSEKVIAKQEEIVHNLRQTIARNN